MKKLKFTIWLLLVLGIGLKAQVSPESIVIKVPSMPSDCTEKVAWDNFFEQLNKLKTEVREEISLRKSKAKSNSKGLDEQAAKNMMNQMGYSVSDADIQKMKTASKEQKKAIADKMLQQNMNMSVEEAKKVSKMSPEAQKAWGEAMSTEMMAEAQANPDKSKAAQMNNMNMYEMVQEQSQLAQKMQAGIMKFEEKLAEFNLIKDKASQEYEKCCEDIDKKYAGMVNRTLGTEHYESIKIEKESCFQNFGCKMIPTQKALFDERFKDIVASGNDYNRMDVLTNELASATTGSKKEIYEPGLMYLETLYEFFSHFGN
jgi:hypothetical protein